MIRVQNLATNWTKNLACFGAAPNTLIVIVTLFIQKMNLSGLTGRSIKYCFHLHSRCPEVPCKRTSVFQDKGKRRNFFCLERRDNLAGSSRYVTKRTFLVKSAMDASFGDARDESSAIFPRINVVGVPVTLNGDLKNQLVEANVGFDTICKVNSQLISNVCTDALSAEKYYYFIRLMGRKASHVAVECSLQSHPNMVILAEEVAASKLTIFDITKQICDAVQARAEQDDSAQLCQIETKKLLVELVQKITSDWYTVLLLAINNWIEDERQNDEASHIQANSRLGTHG
ncbi:hypothetical protein L1987_19352 [Smallanthus sonchifolius]|uniref:Uncharacterized protein n=1 Tax=Smallanthus sonchifolius TaxID=185202 RepID=A0ACB9INV0_9ASTR|nr:hypothetical protein L1987_19352 [Smallanthus sonchifolius]